MALALGGGAAVVVGCGSRAAPAPVGQPARSAAQPASVIYPPVPASTEDELHRQGLEKRTPAAVRRRCERLAAQTKWTVVCPSVVPKGRLTVNYAGGLRKSRDLRSGYMLSMNSPSIRSRGATDPGHWTVARGSRAAMREQLTASGRSHPESSAHTTIDGRGVQIFRMPPFNHFPGIYGGHIVLQWKDGKGLMQLSVHGTDHEPLARALAAALMRR